ncbi:MAG TPA: hypothetical protein VK188_01535 [Holophaga sp.]|nr:hypothetical protein [Holophaga sp.]
MIPALILAALPGAQDLLAARAPNAPAPLAMPGGGEWVHPSVVHVPAGWNGHAWWMAATPYPDSDAAQENPCLFCSDDGVAWRVPGGAANPLVPRPKEARRYNSDPHLALDPGGDLLLFFRTAGGDRGDVLWLMRSRDGVRWSPPRKILETPLEDERQLSPAVLRHGDGWALYYVDASAYPYTVRRRTAPRPEGPWSPPMAVTGLSTPEDRMIWHLDAFREGDAVALLLNTTAVYRTREGGALVLALSRDGLAFTPAGRPLLGGTPGWDRSIYRSCCVPLAGGGHRIYYSAWGPGLGWRLGLAALD